MGAPVRQDDPGRPCPFANAPRASGAVPLDGVITLRQAVALRTERLSSSTPHSSIGPSSTTISARVDTGLAAVVERLDTLIQEHQPGIVAIDSFKALRTFAADEAEFRHSFTTSPADSPSWPFRPCGSASTGQKKATDSAEFAVADGSRPRDQAIRRTMLFAISASASFAEATSSPGTTSTASPPSVVRVPATRRPARQRRRQPTSQ